MNGNIIIGFTVMAACLTVQCFVLAALLDGLVFLEKRGFIKHSFLGTSSLLAAIMIVLLLGNLMQITLWAALFCICGEFVEFATAFYHSTVNFATLGYGDIVMSEKRRLLGALEAVNGVLMLGLSTGFMFAILSNILKRYWNELEEPAH